jgi:hypothetical protein
MISIFTEYYETLVFIIYYYRRNLDRENCFLLDIHRIMFFYRNYRKRNSYLLNSFSRIRKLYMMEYNIMLLQCFTKGYILYYLSSIGTRFTKKLTERDFKIFQTKIAFILCFTIYYSHCISVKNSNVIPITYFEIVNKNFVLRCPS